MHFLQRFNRRLPNFSVLVGCGCAESTRGAFCSLASSRQLIGGPNTINVMFAEQCTHQSRYRRVTDTRAANRPTNKPNTDSSNPERLSENAAPSGRAAMPEVRAKMAYPIPPHEGGDGPTPGEGESGSAVSHANPDAGS